MADDPRIGGCSPLCSEQGAVVATPLRSVVTVESRTQSSLNAFN